MYMIHKKSLQTRSADLADLGRSADPWIPAGNPKISPESGAIADVRVKRTDTH